MSIKNTIYDYIDFVLFETNSLKEYDIEVENKNIQDVINSLKKSIDTHREKINKEAVFLKKNAEWNKYSLCFFGETNAGKSTIIETLLTLFNREQQKGLSIGTGKKDFTTEFEIFDIELNGIKFSIMDMPGIEGNEKLFEKNIKKAVAKSHTIFYVNGGDKKPETGTIEKLKSYLNNQGEVYSITNFRGTADHYDLNENDRKTLLTSKKEKALTSQKKVFEQVLADKYRKAMYVNALMGFCAICKPERKDLKKKQDNYNKVFKGLQKAYVFSNFDMLKTTIIGLSNNAEAKIAAANTSKVLSIFGKLIEELDSVYYNDLNSYLLSDVKGITEQSIKNVQAIFKKYDAFIKHNTNIEIQKLKNRLRNDINVAIDNKKGKEYINKKIKEQSEVFNKDLKKVLNGLVKDLKEEVENELSDLKNRLNLSISIENIDIDMNIEEILEKLKQTLNKILKTIGLLGLELAGIIALLLGPQFIIGIITGIISLIKNIWKFFFSDSRESNQRKRKAKDKANRAVDVLSQRLQSKIHSKVLKELSKNEKNINIELNKIHSMFDQIENFTKMLSVKIVSIKNIYTDLLLLNKTYSND